MHYFRNPLKFVPANNRSPKIILSFTDRIIQLTFNVKIQCQIKLIQSHEQLFLASKRPAWGQSMVP